MKNHASSNAEGEIMMINDNDLLRKELNEKWSKAGKHENDAGRVMTTIKKQ